MAKGKKTKSVPQSNGMKRINAIARAKEEFHKKRADIEKFFETSDDCYGLEDVPKALYSISFLIEFMKPSMLSFSLTHSMEHVIRECARRTVMIQSQNTALEALADKLDAENAAIRSR